MWITWVRYLSTLLAWRYPQQVLNLNLTLIVGILSDVMNLFMTDVDNLGRMATLLRLRA